MIVGLNDEASTVTACVGPTSPTINRLPLDEAVHERYASTVVF